MAAEEEGRGGGRKELTLILKLPPLLYLSRLRLLRHQTPRNHLLLSLRGRGQKDPTHKGSRNRLWKLSPKYCTVSVFFSERKGKVFHTTKCEREILIQYASGVKRHSQLKIDFLLTIGDPGETF